ncbi:MAG: hypothetical protein KF688_00020 [Pirellulales bacterium]|nr:hypothetical protein [Pirellulales bacterium]
MAEVTLESLPFPGSSRDALSEILKQGAQRMLGCAIEAEVAEWIDGRARVTDEQGRRQVVRNGYPPKRTIVTGLGELVVRQPRVHDRRTDASREKFTSQILPPYLRKAIEQPLFCKSHARRSLDRSDCSGSEGYASRMA